MLRTATPAMVRNVGRDRWLRLLNSTSGAIRLQALQGLCILPGGEVEALGLGNLWQRSKQVGLVWIRA